MTVNNRKRGRRPGPDGPTPAEQAEIRRLAELDSVTRRQAADLLGVHQDTISRRLREGLAGAVLEWGGRGREMRLARTLVVRWQAARRCLESGRPCRACDMFETVLRYDGEHLREKRHGRLGCDGCWTGWPPFSPPCGEELVLPGGWIWLTAAERAAERRAK